MNKLYDILMNDNIIESINNNLEELLQIIPEIKPMIKFQHKHPHHHLDVWNHTLLALSISPKELEIRLALLLHDIGKPHSYQDKEVRHFKGHPKVSSQMSKNILKRLNFNEYEISELCYLIEKHDTRISDKDIIENNTLAIKRFKIQICDALAHNPKKLEKRISYLKLIDYKINKYTKKLTIYKINNPKRGNGDVYK